MAEKEGESWFFFFIRIKGSHMLFILNLLTSDVFLISSFCFLTVFLISLMFNV